MNALRSSQTLKPRRVIAAAIAMVAGSAFYIGAFPPSPAFFLIWVALVPLLWLASLGPRRSWPWMLASSFMISLGLHAWLAVFHPLATAFHLVYCGAFGIFTPLMLFSMLVKRSRLGVLLAFPAAWTIIEYVKAESLLRFGFGGGPRSSMGNPGV